MREFQRGMFARSLAGHDKGRLYIILDTDGEYVYLADGKNRLPDAPKKKRRCHVQVDYHISAFIQDRLNSCGRLRDEDIKRAIKLKEAKS